MFEIGWSELLLVGSVALIVIGPKDLPAVLRTVGRTVTKVRRMAGDFQGQFQDALREADMEDVTKDISSIAETARKTVSPKALFDPLSNIRDEIRSTVTGAGAAVASIPAAVEASAQPVAGPEAGREAPVAPPESAALHDMRDEIRKAMAGEEGGSAALVPDPLDDVLPPPPVSSVEITPLEPPVVSAPVAEGGLPPASQSSPAEDLPSVHPKAS
ncbi:Sec-independent protein translocase protein TatB [Xanthobacter sp. TB0139]|uniref:Sec-independent protein translocase protein TatB n=1 Tax=Xanthobacter sp. TB0139 TaxID=3459178 RepID=UPI0040399CAA